MNRFFEKAGCVFFMMNLIGFRIHPPTSFADFVYFR